MNLLTSKNPLKDLWHLLTGVPKVEPQLFYFKNMEDVQLSVDWGRRTIDFVGGKVVRATDYEEVWIRHLVRLHKQQKESPKT